MLKKFSVKNYKGFKDELVFDFSKTKDYKFNTHAIKNNLLKTSVIYGKNSSGKSNLGLALFDITLHLVDKNQSESQNINYLNANSNEKYASFSYTFLIDNKEIIYNYKKNESVDLIEEELIIDGYFIFKYDFLKKEGIFLNLKIIDAETLDFNNMKMNISILKYIANNANLDQENIIKKIMFFVDNMLWYRSLGYNQYIGYAKGGETITSAIINSKKILDFQNFLQKMDINLKLEVLENAFGNQLIAVKYNEKYLPFWETASSGTQVLTLHYYWSQSFKNVSFLFIDEFDAFYHADVAEKILTYISKENDFQSVFTTHNTSLMSNHILRPDNYHILCEGKLKNLPECTDRELREAHNLEKMYKNGSFE